MLSVKWYKSPVKILLPSGDGDAPLNCPHEFVGICNICQGVWAVNSTSGEPELEIGRAPWHASAAVVQNRAHTGELWG